MKKYINVCTNSYEYNVYIYNKLIEICSPLFTYTQINFFGYMRVFTDGRYFAISTNLDWQKHFLQDLEKHGEIFHKQTIKTPLKKVTYLVWPENVFEIKDNTFIELHNYNIKNGLSVYKKEEEYIESWSFAIPNENSSQYYLNSLALINKFIIYFQQKAKHLLNFNNPNILSNFKNFSIKPIFDNDIFLNNCEKEIAQFFREIELEEAYLLFNRNNISLSKREMECLYYLSSGKTMKEIAKIMNISPRTVEYYINNSKIKNGLHYKSELITMYQENQRKYFYEF